MIWIPLICALVFLMLGELRRDELMYTLLSSVCWFISSAFTDNAMLITFFGCMGILILVYAFNRILKMWR